MAQSTKILVSDIINGSFRVPRSQSEQDIYAECPNCGPSPLSECIVQSVGNETIYTHPKCGRRLFRIGIFEAGTEPENCTRVGSYVFLEGVDFVMRGLPTPVKVDLFSKG